MAREMKDSGIEWIGEIPADWSLIKMNNVCKIITDYVASGSFASLAKNVVYLDEPDYAMLIRTIDISNKGYSSKPVFINKSAYNFLSNSNLYGGEIVLPNIGASVGDVYIVPKLYDKMSLAPNSIMLRSLINDKFVYYYFFSDAGRYSLLDIAQSTAQPKFNKTNFRQLKLVVPNDIEQKKIADFLDKKCSQIDTALEKTRNTIEEYKKFKQAIITKAVTKDIRGDRPMKDSGIEWVGEIPEEWEIRNISSLFNFCGGFAFKSDKFIDNSNNQVLRIGNIRDDCLLIDEKQVFISDEYALEAINYQAKKNDILFSMTGTKGKQDYFYTVLVEGISNKKLFINQRVGCFRAKDADLSMRYFCKQLKLKAVKDNVFLFETGTANQGNIGIETIRRTKLLVPPNEEQQEIADYLDKKCAAIDTLIAKKEQIITDLEYYKKSLIYEYVTGKKEVC